MPRVMSRNSIRIAVSGTEQRRAGVRRIYLGFCLACLCGSVALWTRIFASTDWAGGLLSFLVVPFMLTFLVTRDLAVSLGLVWINEIFFGVDGRWLQLGPLPGRGVLLIAFLAGSYVLRLGTRNRLSQSSRVGTAVWFYGMIVPCWLFFYSVLGRVTPVAAAFGDATRYFVILAYFPLRKLIRTEFDVVLGWVCGGVVMVSAMMFFSAVGPQPLATIVYSAYSGAERIATLTSGMSRTATPLLVLSLIGVFLGIVYAVDNSQSKSARLAGLILTSISLAPIVISFMRGPLWGMLGVSLILLAAYTRDSASRYIVWRFGSLIVGLGILSYIMMSFLVPEGVKYFSLGDRTVYEYFADLERQEQAHRMLDAFSDAPFLGQGVGVPIYGYQRGVGDDVLSFELHYHMLLYRVGGIVFTLFVVPIIWFFFEPFRLCRNRSVFLLQRKGKFAMAVLSALLVIFVVGATNPYLLTAFTMFLIALYLAIKQEWSLS